MILVIIYQYGLGIHFQAGMLFQDPLKIHVLLGKISVTNRKYTHLHVFIHIKDVLPHIK